MNLRIFVVLAALVAPVASAAATDQEKFEKLLKKTTISALFEDFLKAKVACVCNDGSITNGAGVLRREFIGYWRVSCQVPLFDGTGHVYAFSGCSGSNWELLTK